jgi:1,4-dihydroxy-2-naphthoate octaprenyltransferase
MDESSVKTNSFRAWVLAARPKTLTGASVPVMIGVVMSIADCIHEGFPFHWLPALLCFLFAFVMQIDANFINDFFDYVNGNDDETRLGPKRACAEGWVSIEAMKKAIALTTVFACILGLPLVYWGGLEMILVGVVCVLFCFLYTTHLSYLGLGDLLVLVFFGIVPVCITYYIQLHTCTLEVLFSSIACGLVIDTLLIINNYRDMDNDERSGKVTMCVRMGRTTSRGVYLGFGIVAVLMGCFHVFYGHLFAFLLPVVYLLPHYKTWITMVRIGRGRELNSVLAMTARNMFIYGLLNVIGYLLDFSVSLIS